MKSWGSVGDSRRDRDRGTYGAVARVLGGYVGLWRPGECDLVGDCCGGLGVRLWGSDKSDRPSERRAGGNAHAVGHEDKRSRGQCKVSIIIMIVSKEKYMTIMYHIKRFSVTISINRSQAA